MSPYVIDDPRLPIDEGIEFVNLLLFNILRNDKILIKHKNYNLKGFITYKSMKPKFSKDIPILPISLGIDPSNSLLSKYLEVNIKKQNKDNIIIFTYNNMEPSFNFDPISPIDVGIFPMILLSERFLGIITINISK